METALLIAIFSAGMIAVLLYDRVLDNRKRAKDARDRVAARLKTLR